MQTDNKPKNQKPAVSEKTTSETLQQQLAAAELKLMADGLKDKELFKANQAVIAKLEAAIKSQEVADKRAKIEADKEAIVSGYRSKLQAYRDSTGDNVAVLEQELLDSMTGGAKKSATTSTGVAGSKGGTSAAIRQIILDNIALGFTAAKQVAKDTVNPSSADGSNYARGTVDTVGTQMKNEGLFA